MEEKGYVKFQGSESNGVLNYVKIGEDYLSVTMGDSRKIKHLNEFGSIKIADGMTSSDFEEKSFEIVTDKNYVKEVFDYMIKIEHSHYKAYDEKMVVLKHKL